jgi:hypothetical protein
VAAQQLVEVVDPQDDGAPDGQSLLDRLHRVLQKILSFIAEAPTMYVSHT